MNAQEFNGVARQIERLTKRVVVAEERGKQQESALALIAIHMGQERDAFDPMDLVALIKAKTGQFADAQAKIAQLESTIKTDAEKYIAGIEGQYNETRKILGARNGETTSDAAKRVVAERDEQRIEIEAWRADHLGRWREMIGSLPEESLEVK